MQLTVVLPQGQAAVRRYIEETGLPFDVLVDDTRAVSKAYGVWHRFGVDAWNTARPSVFLIDRRGNVRYSFIGERQDEFPAPATLLAAIERLT